MALAPAADASLTVSPPRVVLQVKSGKSQAGFFTLRNAGDEPLEITVEPEDWAEGMGGARKPVSWLTVKPAALTLAPGKEARVKYTIRTPKDASGELRTQVFFTTKGVGPQAMAMRSRLGAIVYVALEGTEQIAAEVTRISAAYTAATPGVAQPDRLDVSVGILNKSNVHIVPEGRVILRGSKSERVAAVDFPQGWGLLPREEDLYHAIGSGVYIKPGRYTAEVEVFYGADVRKPKRTVKTFEAELAEDGSWRFSELVSAEAAAQPAASPSP